MNFSLRNSATILFSIVTFAAAGASQASGATVVETVGNPPRTLPVAQWISEMTFPTPDVKIRVHYDDCPGGGTPLACAGGLNEGAYDITITDRMKEFSADYMRSTIHHEVGHVVDQAYFGEQTRNDFAIRMGFPADRAFNGDLPVSSGAKPTWVEPSEWFAEVYSLCAWGPDRPDGLHSYGFRYTYRQVLPLCHQISLQMTGQPLPMPASPAPSVSCSPRCQVKLGANRRFVTKKKLLPGTVSAVVRFGKKVAMLEKGCKGNVRIAGDVVRLNYCSGILRATAFTYKRVTVMWWGQTPAPVEPPALPVLAAPSTEVKVDGGAAGPFPLEKWVSDSQVSVPNIKVTVVYGRCVNESQAACTSSFASQNKFIWMNLNYLGQEGKDSEYFRALFYRSLASFITRAYLGPEQQQKFKALLGIPNSTRWGAYDPSIPATTSTPAKLFAEAYATCAWGGERPAATISFGFDRSYSSLQPVCARIEQLLDGTPAEVAPLLPPPALACGSFCSTRLNRKVTWSTTLPSPAAQVVVKFGKRLSALPKGCSGTVRIGRATVRLNHCGTVLRATSIGRGKPVVRYWNQPT